MTKHVKPTLGKNYVLTRGSKINAVNSVISTMFGINVLYELQAYFDLYDHRIATKGKKEACKFLKSLYVFSVKISLDYKRDDIEVIPWTKTNKRKFPLCIKYMEKLLLSSDVKHRRAALTILGLYNTIYCAPELDVASITTKGPGPESFQSHMASWMKILYRIKKFSPKVEDTSMYLSSNRGPNGMSVRDSHKDLMVLQQYPHLLESMRLLNQEIDRVAFRNEEKLEINLAGTYGSAYDYHEDFDTLKSPRSERKKIMVDGVTEINTNLPSYSNLSHSRIQTLSEGGCKTRTIAMGDWWTQDCLKPIHRWAYKFLAKFESDGTYSHNRVSDVVRKYTEDPDCEAYSFDLSSATDRFPIWLQKEFLKVMLGEDVSNHWYNLMVNREFTIRNTSETIKYQCGQPMGFLSSWAIFALVHHTIVETAAFEKGLRSFRNYCMIGDDVVIFNKKVAFRYAEILQQLEVPISKSKSITADGFEPSRAEIAKRLFLNGSEISPVPCDVIFSSKKDFTIFPIMIRLLQDRGVEDSFESLPVQELSRSFYPKRYSKKVLDILTFPVGNSPLLKVEDSSWKEYEVDLIDSTFKQIRNDLFIKISRDLYISVQDPIEDRLGSLGDLLKSDKPLNVSAHPLIRLLKASRDRCGSINQWMTINNSDIEGLTELAYLVNPTIGSYLRKTHKTEKIRSSLVLDTLRSLEKGEDVKTEHQHDQKEENPRPDLTKSTALLPDSVKRMLGLM